MGAFPIRLQFLLGIRVGALRMLSIFVFMKSLDEFTDFYTSTLAPSLFDLEEKRLAMRQMGWRTAFAGLCIIFIHFAILFLFSLKEYYWTLAITLLVTPPAVYYIYRKRYYDDSIPDDFKNTAVAQLVNFASEELSYDPEGFVDFEDFRASELYPLTPDHYGGDDLMTGEVDGKPVTISELIVQVQDQDFRAKEKDNWITTFKGLFMVIDFGQEFPYRTFVFSDQIQQKLGYSGRLMQAGNVMYGFYVNTHDSEFSDRFVVYCENEIEGERLITKRFKEELIQLQDNTGCDIHLSLLGSKVYIAIERELDFFAIDLNRSLLDLDYIASFYKDLYYAFNIINDLDVNDMFAPEDEAGEEGDDDEEEEEE